LYRRLTLPTACAGDSRFCDVASATPPPWAMTSPLFCAWARACPSRPAGVRRGVVPVPTGPTVRAQARSAATRLFGDHHATAPTALAGDRRSDRLSPLPSVCCLESEDAQERCPARIADALGQMVVIRAPAGHRHVCGSDR